MTIQGKLIPATFRGVPFSLTGQIQIGGKKVSIHEYPNQILRFVEDLGGLQKRFSVNAIVNNSPGQEDYFERKAALLVALDLPYTGILTLPFGSIKPNVLAISYRIVEEYKKLGVGTFSIDFIVSSGNVFPILGSENVGVISDLIENAIAGSGDAIVGLLK